MTTSSDDDRAVGLVMRVECFRGGPEDVAKGSRVSECEKCHEPVYVAPATDASLDAGTIQAIECCHCHDSHDPMQMLTRMIANGKAHFHEFPGGLCSCGLTENEWIESCPPEARQIHETMRLIFIGAVGRQGLI